MPYGSPLFFRPGQGGATPAFDAAVLGGLHRAQSERAMRMTGQRDVTLAQFPRLQPGQVPDAFELPKLQPLQVSESFLQRASGVPTVVDVIARSCRNQHGDTSACVSPRLGTSQASHRYSAYRARGPFWSGSTNTTPARERSTVSFTPSAKDRGSFRADPGKDHSPRNADKRGSGPRCPRAADLPEPTGPASSPRSVNAASVFYHRRGSQGSAGNPLSPRRAQRPSRAVPGSPATHPGSLSTASPRRRSGSVDAGRPPVVPLKEPRVAPAPAPGQSTMRWKKGKQIGQGAFGCVFIGLHLGTGQLMAVKNVSFDMRDPKVRQRISALQHEIRVMKELSHPNVVRYICSERQGNSINIFMEYVPGGSLQSVIMQFGELNEVLAKAYAWQMVGALCFLHENKIVHRDVKGANVLLAVTGDCKLSDFGSAATLQDIAETAKRKEEQEGTACWMAPEVIRCDGFSFPCDVWSLGCTVMEMLTAEAPFMHVASSAIGVMNYVGAEIDEAIHLPPGLAERSSPACVHFMSRCLTRNAEARPTCAVLLQHPWFSDDSQDSAISKAQSHTVPVSEASQGHVQQHCHSPVTAGPAKPVGALLTRPASPHGRVVADQLLSTTSSLPHAGVVAEGSTEAGVTPSGGSAPSAHTRRGSIGTTGSTDRADRGMKGRTRSSQDTRAVTFGVQGVDGGEAREPETASHSGSGLGWTTTSAPLPEPAQPAPTRVVSLEPCRSTEKLAAAPPPPPADNAAPALPAARRGSNASSTQGSSIPFPKDPSAWASGIWARDLTSIPPTREPTETGHGRGPIGTPARQPSKLSQPDEGSSAVGHSGGHQAPDADVLPLSRSRNSQQPPGTGTGKEDPAHKFSPASGEHLSPLALPAPGGVNMRITPEGAGTPSTKMVVPISPRTQSTTEGFMSPVLEQFMQIKSACLVEALSIVDLHPEVESAGALTHLLHTARREQSGGALSEHSPVPSGLAPEGFPISEDARRASRDSHSLSEKRALSSGELNSTSPQPTRVDTRQDTSSSPWEVVDGEPLSNAAGINAQLQLMNYMVHQLEQQPEQVACIDDDLEEDDLWTEASGYQPAGFFHGTVRSHLHVYIIAALLFGAVVALATLLVLRW
eukprot:TRINITY_DN2715_c0_g1_i1.p1 TRINITY_DN2715_c0_g1~~TRINITY_DN2715_c0_g1_i1.p1  ORF type:complete len:1115 (+),score=64.74 TRINITY_DN2715_c0_g1_i1:128-3472(+)